MKKIILLIIISSGFIVSCATPFNNGFTEGNTISLSKDNISNLSGTYHAYASKKFDENGASFTLSDYHNPSSIQNRLSNNFPNIKNLTDLKKYILNESPSSSELKDIDKVVINFTDNFAYFKLMKDNKEIKSHTIKGKLKKGFFVFEKENNCIKIPLVASGCIKSQRRVGLGIDGDLILQEINVYDIKGFNISKIIDFVGNSTEAAYGFQKIDK